MALTNDTIKFLRHSIHMNFSEESKGYSREQVQKVLAKLPPLANEVERLQNEIANLKAKADAAESRLVEAQAPAEVAVAVPEMPAMASSEFDETLRKTLVTAQANAQSTVRAAQEEAERLRTEAEFQSNAILADARDQASEIEREAESSHEEMKAETEAERARLLKDASDDVKKRLSSIEEELVEAHDSERSKLLEQISELQETHKLLQGDVSRFEEHLTSRREEVRVALADITAVLDDPEKLRVEEPIEPAEVPVIDTDEFEPISVEVDSVSDLETEALVAEEAVASNSEESLDMDEFESLTIVDEESDAQEVFLDEVDDDATSIVEAVEVDDDDGGKGDIPPPPPPAGDAYTEELRRAVDEESDDEDIKSFFSEDSVGDEGKRGGIFGRRGK